MGALPLSFRVRSKVKHDMTSHLEKVDLDLCTVAEQKVVPQGVSFLSLGTPCFPIL